MYIYTYIYIEICIYIYSIILLAVLACVINNPNGKSSTEDIREEGRDKIPGIEKETGNNRTL
jgi:hypothetical protein